MNHSKQIELALDLGPLVETPEGYFKCVHCKLIMPNTKQYLKRQHAKDDSGFCRVCSREKEFEYLNTEKGYLHGVFNGVLRRQRGKSYNREAQNKRNLKMVHTLNTIEKLFSHWESHKRKYGKRCAYTGCIMTHKRLSSNKGKRLVVTNISVDRLHPGIGYTELNTVFCTWYFNDKKNNFSPKDCLKVINFCKERGRYDLL